MFKSTNSQLDNSGAFGVQLGNNLGISEVINGNSGRANKLIQSSANNYFKSKLQSYQAHHLHTSGQVNPVYPEDIFGAAKVVGSVGRLTLTTLRQKGASVAGRNTNVVKTTCTGGNVCFTAGTLIHTIHGLKPIGTIEHGDLIWSRQEFGDEYDYRPVIATKVTPNQEIYEVVVKHSNNSTETFKTTKEHPFWVEGIGWLKASLLEQGMTLLDKHGLPNVTILSQTKLTHTDTVYNFEVQDFHTYHVGRLGVWVHNDGCCGLLQKGGNKINGNTSKKLNEAWGTNYTSRDIGRGLESLKKENGIPANHHGKIMSNGGYVGENGINYGNILDYMP